MEDGIIKAPEESGMEQQPPRSYEEDVIDLGVYWAILRPNLWKIALFSLLVSAVTLGVMFQYPNIYQSTAVITPEKDERRQTSSLGALASFGIDFGGPSRVEDLESLFKSNDLAVRVFRKHNPWPILLGERYDPATGGVKATSRTGFWGDERNRKPLGDWDAIRAVKARLRISVIKKSNTISISFESPSPEGSADIVKYFLDEGKSRLQEEALDRAVKNKVFIEEQTRKTVDALTRDRLYSLYGQEVEKEMIARNREQYGFKVIDSPRVPDRKFKPKRVQNALLAYILACFFGCLFYIVRGTGGAREKRDSVRTDIP